MKKIFVTGASGFIGRNVCKELTKSGFDVIGLVRSEKSGDILTSYGVKWVLGDINNPDGFKKELSSASVLVHLAAQRVNWGLPEEIFKTNSYSINRLVETGQNLKQVVVTSSVYVYGDQAGLMTENSRLLASDLYGKSKIKAEEQTIEVCSKRKIKYTILRPAIVYGSDMDNQSFLIKLIKLIKSKMPIMGNGQNFVQLIHVSDLAKGYVAAVRKGAKNKIYNLAYDRPIKLCDLIDLIKKRYGWGYKTYFIPVWPFYILAEVIEFIYPLLFKTEPPLSKTKLRTLTGNWLFSIESAKKDLGFTPRIDYALGIGQLSIDV